MTTQPGCVASGIGGDDCCAKQGAASKKTAMMPAQKDSRTNRESTCAMRCGGFNLFMEIAFLSNVFMGIEIAQPVGTAVRWVRSANRSQGRKPAQPSAHWRSLTLRTK